MTGLNITKKLKKVLVQNSVGIVTDTEATHQPKQKRISTENADPGNQVDEQKPINRNNAIKIDLSHEMSL